MSNDRPRRYFAAIGDKQHQGTGWPVAFISGASSNDRKDWSLECLGFHADEMREAWMDAKEFSELVAGLLNAYYNGQETGNLDEKTLIRMGKPLQELNIPHTANPEIPFGLPF